jgi:GNAT superfamily N-acetyltransferase
MEANPMHFTRREIPFGSSTYATSVILRERVLRMPLGLSWENDAFAGEDHSFHLGLFSDEILVGCLILKPIDQTHIKMRQVAIAPEMQGHGLGSELIAYAEEFAVTAGYRQISAHAREAVVTFYRKLGYTVSGDVFEEVSIPHYLVQKTLS